MKMLIDFFFLFLFSPDEKLEDLKAQKRKIVSVVVMSNVYSIYYLCILLLHHNFIMFLLNQPFKIS